MVQIIKSLASFCLSVIPVCLTVRAPTVAIFVRFWWNFAQKVGSRKVKMLSLGVKIRWHLPLFCPNFSPRNAFSMGRSKYRSNQARGPTAAVRAQTTCLGSGYKHKIAKCCNPQFCPLKHKNGDQCIFNGNMFRWVFTVRHNILSTMRDRAMVSKDHL